MQKHQEAKLAAQFSKRYAQVKDMSLAMSSVLSQSAPHTNAVTLKVRPIERIWVQLSPEPPHPVYLRACVRVCGLVCVWPSLCVVMSMCVAIFVWSYMHACAVFVRPSLLGTALCKFIDFRLYVHCR